MLTFAIQAVSLTRVYLVQKRLFLCMVAPLLRMRLGIFSHLTPILSNTMGLNKGRSGDNDMNGERFGGSFADIEVSQTCALLEIGFKFVKPFIGFFGPDMDSEVDVLRVEIQFFDFVFYFFFFGRDINVSY